MKKILGITLALLLVSATYVSAQTRAIGNYLDSSNVEKTANTNTTERKFTGKLIETRQKNMRTLFARMLVKFDSHVTRLEALIEKIQSKLETAISENPNSNFAQSKMDLRIAKEKLNNVKINIDNSKIQLENIIGSENPGGEFLELKVLIEDIKSDLKECQRLLAKIMVQIKRVETSKK